MRDGNNLDNRQQEVLATIIRQYVATGAPVGSKMVAAQFPEPISSATIRNLMAELEAAGYLMQPHTSAGRVPADKAYRFYVDGLSRRDRLGAATEQYIEEQLGGGPYPADELMERISQILSEVSNHLGVVLAPALEEKLLEHIKFVRLPDRRVLAVIVSRPDLIENRLFGIEDETSQEDLDRAANYLNQEFRGWSLRTIRLEIVKRVEEMKAASDRLLSDVARLLMWGALAQEAPAPLFVGGAANILDEPEFVETGKVKALLAAIEEKAKVVKILSACLDAPHRGVQALIGRENPNSEMRQCSFIVAPYHYRRRPVGALGLIGPTRMEYGRAIRTVEYVAQITSRVLSTN
ncbi:MAG TPA: heat-inducible transcriptional repressor HrcA [Terriglobia bacterium]|nr:heat-inducible transcriptional repressor HrcA [Terriglobia bacterium]